MLQISMAFNNRSLVLITIGFHCGQKQICPHHLPWKFQNVGAAAIQSIANPVSEEDKKM